MPDNDIDFEIHERVVRLRLDSIEAKLDKLIVAVNTIGELCDNQDRNLTTIVETVQEFSNKMSSMNPLQMMKSVMGKG